MGYKGLSPQYLYSNPKETEKQAKQAFKPLNGISNCTSQWKLK